MDDWGLPKDNQLLFWSWVGGRFSMWSAIGLAIAIKFGMSVFRELLTVLMRWMSILPRHRLSKFALLDWIDGHLEQHLFGH